MKKIFAGIAFLALAAVFSTYNIFAQDKAALEKSALHEYVQQMTARQKIGALCVMNFRFWTDSPLGHKEYKPSLAAENPDIFTPQNTINSTIYKTIRNYNIGSVILFAENMSDAAAAKKFIRDLNSAALDGGNLPLLFLADQEGGNVLRVYDFSTPGAMSIAKSGEKQNAYLCGKANGQLLLDYGINVDLAPVCDVASNPHNPVIGIRSFSSDPKEAAEYSLAFSQGLMDAGVLPCAKHFPGHGDTSLDSHKALPAIHANLSKWKKIEAVPFKENIAGGVPLIMTAHIQCPRLDKTRIKSGDGKKEIVAPATLSKKILTKILRGSLGYKGAVISDAMDMAAIYDNWTSDQSFVLAVNAGCDLIINPINVYSRKDLEFLEDFFCKVEEALQSGALEKKALDSAVVRVLELKQKAGLIKIQDGRITALPQKIIPMPKEKKQEAARLSNKIQMQAAAASASKLSLPLRARSKKIAAFVPYNDKMEVLQKNFEARGIQNAQLICYEARKSPSLEDLQKIKAADLILIFTQLTGNGARDKKLWEAAYPAALAKEIKKAQKAARAVGVSMNLPYDKDSFPAKDGFGWLALYNYTQIGYARAVQALFD